MQATAVTAKMHGESYLCVLYRFLPETTLTMALLYRFLIYHTVSLNTFGCPISSQGSHANGHALTPEQLEEQHTSSGLWITASRVNHSCFSNARRSFIGDMQIVRATCDMPPDTEITFGYQAAKFGGTESDTLSYVDATQSALQNWGFECTCVICTSDLTTPLKTRRQRNALLDDLESSLKHSAGPQLPKAETLLAALEKTYSLPAIQVPRLALWQPYLFVTRQYVKQKNPGKTISTALNLLAALGFVIKGLSVPLPEQSSDKIIPNANSPNKKSSSKLSSNTDSSNGLLLNGQSPQPESKFQVEKWGLVIDHVIEVFMRIWKACQTVQPELCTPVGEAAKTAYMICVGEADTFWETYGKWYGMKES